MSAQDAPAMEITPVSGARGIIRSFTLRRTAAGASIFGLFVAIESLAQAAGIVAAYPNAAERAKIIYGLADNAALGIFYGDRHADIVNPAGYMVYRVLPILALIGAVWALMFVTKMLRGQEDNGRWELLLAGPTSARRATAKTIGGTVASVAIAYVLTVLALVAAGHSPKLDFSATGCLYYGLAVVMGALVAVGIGAITSQLAATRRRAVLYGLGVIVAFFVLRSVANVVDGVVWLKNVTPFGWIDKLHPFYHSQPIWVLPLAGLAVACTCVAIWLSGRRDMAESFIADADSAKPRFGLLNSQLGFDFRETRNVMAGWLLASVGFAAVVSAVTKTVAQSFAGTDSLTKTFSNLTGNPYAQLEVAYLSTASYITVTILMIMVTVGMGAVRDEESSSRLENFISGTTSRRTWLSMRLSLMLAGVTVVTLVTNLVVWVIARLQGIQVGLPTLLFGGLNILGPVVLLLGIGVLLFGIKPRLVTIAMYALIAWSFTIDIVASALKTNKYVADTSLLHHISLVPAANPNWGSFAVLAGVGLGLMGLGVLMFQRRDLYVE